ncbi:hypothetical protein ACFL15_00435 [Patescibacteria group bacterium]
MTNTISYLRDSKKYINLLGKKGKVISFTQVFSPRSSMKDISPYYICLCKLKDNTNLILSVCKESKNIQIKDKVQIVLRRIKKPSKEEIVEYGLKFKKI